MDVKIFQFRAVFQFAFWHYQLFRPGIARAVITSVKVIVDQNNVSFPVMFTLRIEAVGVVLSAAGQTGSVQRVH
jgi:hypothetical protein